MAKEIERKFIVCDNSYRPVADSRKDMIQAYLSTDIDATVRVRIIDTKAYLTIKGRNEGAVRDEWEYEIPLNDAHEMIAKCARSAILSKTRWEVGPWEIDEYHGALEGLTIAEIELPSPDSPIPLMTFIGKEVTGDPRYFNSALVNSGKIPD